MEPLPLSTWTFAHDGDGQHMGPMAEGFHDAFNPGDDSETIATVDVDRVALAAIQALDRRQ